MKGCFWYVKDIFEKVLATHTSVSVRNKISQIVSILQRKMSHLYKDYVAFSQNNVCAIYSAIHCIVFVLLGYSERSVLRQLKLLEQK